MMTCYPVAAPIRTTEPTLLQEPVTVVEARRQVMVADGIDYHDERLKDYIITARQQVEHDAGLVCYTGAFTWKFTDFPNRDWFEIPNIRPVTAVSSITYVATDGDTDTWSSSEYTLDTSSLVAFVRLNYGYVWPTIRGDINGITVSMTAGYSSVAAVPRKVKQAVLLAISVLWSDAMGDTNLQGIQSVDATRLAYERQIELIRRDIYA